MRFAYLLFVYNEIILFLSFACNNTLHKIHYHR